jgi:hypothetical protein
MAEDSKPEYIYVVDASSWIHIESHHNQNAILYAVVKLIEDGKIICPPESWKEVVKCPWVKAWINQHKKSMIRAISDVEYLLRLGRVTMQFSAMAAARGRKEKADQYVVAMAWHLNATGNPTKYVVVANETATKRPNRKIPTACSALGFECLELEGMLKREFPQEI